MCKKLLPKTQFRQKFRPKFRLQLSKISAAKISAQTSAAISVAKVANFGCTSLEFRLQGRMLCKGHQRHLGASAFHPGGKGPWATGAHWITGGLIFQTLQSLSYGGYNLGGYNLRGYNVEATVREASSAGVAHCLCNKHTWFPYEVWTRKQTVTNRTRLSASICYCIYSKTKK